MPMEYRRLGRTGLDVSVVGFGTNELRLVPEQQAIETLLRGFDLGVNIVHTSPDYEGAEDLVARAVAETDRHVVVASQGYDVHYNSDGPVSHFEQLFEATCARLKTERLDLYGIAAVDDREAFQENVWGKNGMVEFLLRKKDEGRLGAMYCTVHGEPRFIRKLVDSDVFDAIMLSYNPLGFHLLTLNPPPGRHFENLPRNRYEIFPACADKDIGVMVMMALAGGLLTASRAFPSDAIASPNGVTAGDVLRAILHDPHVGCVLPGTASLEEAEENASAGHGPLIVAPDVAERLADRVATVRTTTCSRCGTCDSLCSQGLPVSWLFRAHDMSSNRAESFETWKEIEYFRLHPNPEATCLTCPDVTCICPYEIDIPTRLIAIHDDMTTKAERGLTTPAEDRQPLLGDETFGARLLSADIPVEIAAGATTTCRVHLENAGQRGWFAEDNEMMGGVRLAVFAAGKRVADVRPRDDVHHGGRGHLVFELTAPRKAGSMTLRLRMLGQHEQYSDSGGFVVLEREIGVRRNRPIAERRSQWLERLRGGRTGVPPATPGRTNRSRYAVDWTGHNLPGAWPEDEPYYAYVSARNCGSHSWRSSETGGVRLAVHVNGELYGSFPLPHETRPGEDVLVGFPLLLAGGSDAPWRLSVNFLDHDVAWFHDHGVASLTTTISRQTRERTPADDARAVARRSNWSFYTTSQGVAHGRDGRAYPVLIDQAAGARVRDAAGNEWIDWVMGWGSSLLGYAHPDVRAAIANVLETGSLPSLPHTVEMDVTERLCNLVPCAEVVLFGKNGSDVCTAAVRAARVHTGRSVVLFSGYHGWQEPFAGVYDAGLGQGPHDHAYSFQVNDLESLCGLVAAHSGNIAAIMLEPAGQVEGVEGPIRDCDRSFLRHVAEICRDQDAVLIFDEIMTGFRYPDGSVQRATGITPDLAVFGKALANGMPLSALVGRADVLGTALDRLFYHPTYKSEVYSFAAAAAALSVYERDDVPRLIRKTGQRLAAGVGDICRELGIDGALTGVPYRMVFRFDEPDDRRRAYKRTLLQQELAKGGVLTFRAVMLPSVAHDDHEIDETLVRFRAALDVVRRVAADASFSSHLEIPLIY